MATLGTETAREGPLERIVFLKPQKIGRARVFVDPPIFYVGNGDSPRTIRFDNQTGDLVKIWLPNADRFLKPQRNGKDFSMPIAVPPEGLELDVKVKPDGPEVGHFQYHVYCEGIKDFAEGNSPPIMHIP